MGEQGQVIKTVDNQVVVRLERTEACAKCRACIAGMTSKEMLVTAKNACGANELDWVEIELEQSNFLLAVGIMYGIPLVLMMTGFLSGYYLARFAGLPYDGPIGFGTGILLMCLAFLWIHKHEHKWSAGRFNPVAARRVKG